MNIAKTLSVDTLFLGLKSNTKNELIAEMVDKLMAVGKVSDRETLLQALYAREKKMSTGMQNGIAIPHAKTAAVDSLVAAVGIHREGMDFNCMDGQPAHIFIMAISPINRTGPHIQFLAEISRILSNSDIRDKMLKAASAEELLNLMRK